MIAGNLRWMKSALLGRSRHRPKVLISSIRMSKNFFRANLIDSSNSESPSGGNRRAMRHEPARPDQLAHSAGACRCRQRARVGGCARRAASASQPPRNTSSAISTAPACAAIPRGRCSARSGAARASSPAPCAASERLCDDRPPRASPPNSAPTPSERRGSQPISRTVAPRNAYKAAKSAPQCLQAWPASCGGSGQPIFWNISRIC